MSQEKLLTAALAEEFIRSQGLKSIAGFTSIEDQAAVALAACQYSWLSLNGLTSLSDAAAVALASYKGRLELGGVASLGDAVALALAEHNGSLSLRGLLHISETEALALSRHNGDLDLSDAGWAQYRFGQQLVRRADYQAIRPRKAKSKDLFNKGLMGVVMPGGKMTVDLWPEGRLFMLQPEDWDLPAIQSPDIMIEFNPSNLSGIIDSIETMAMKYGDRWTEFSDVYPESVADIRWLRKHVSVARCVGTAVHSPAGVNAAAAVRLGSSEGRGSSSKNRKAKKNPSEPGN
jgi:hypothetical protein